jgi:pimeloyl-ACP methyl ester carboxylesterase
MLHQISTNAGGNRVADVLFIHGLGGDPFSTWRYGSNQSTSWPHWLAAEFPDVCFWSLQYAASATKRARGLRRWISGNKDAGHATPCPDRARTVVHEMVQNQFGRRPLLLIGHSLGGLLAKQLLRRASDDTHGDHRGIFDNAKAVLFLGTPHHGAALASMANRFSAIFGPTASVEDLRAQDAHLSDLYDWYRNHSLRIETFTYFETRDVFGFRIVDRTSSHSGVGPDPVPLDEDHISIAKPLNKDHQVVDKAREFVKLLKQGMSGNHGKGGVSVEPLFRFPVGDHHDSPDSCGEDTPFDSWVGFVADRVLEELKKLPTNTKRAVGRALAIEFTEDNDAVCIRVKQFFKTHSSSKTQNVAAISKALETIDGFIDRANNATVSILRNIQDWLMTTLVCPTDNPDIAVIRDSCDGVLFVGHPAAAELLFSVADLRKPTFIRTDDGKPVGNRLLMLVSPPLGDQRPLHLVQHFVTEMADRIGAVAFDNSEIDQADDGKCIKSWAEQLKLIFRTERARTRARFYCCCSLPDGTPVAAQVLTLLRDFSSQLPDLGVFHLRANQDMRSAEDVIVPLLHKRFNQSH